jgi:hypothetical protein
VHCSLHVVFQTEKCGNGQRKRALEFFLEEKVFKKEVINKGINIVKLL